MLTQVAYGKKGLGNSKFGIPENIERIDANLLQKFRSKVTPSKCIIAANGVNDHDAFLRLVEKKLESMDKLPFISESRVPTIYQGGDIKQAFEGPSTRIDLAFPTVSWESLDVSALYVMNTLIGSATSFSSGGPGKGMYCRAITNLMWLHHHV